MGDALIGCRWAGRMRRARAHRRRPAGPLRATGPRAPRPSAASIPRWPRANARRPAASSASTCARQRRQGAARRSASRPDWPPPFVRSRGTVTSTICSPSRAMTASATAPPATHCTGSSAISRNARLTTRLAARSLFRAARRIGAAQRREQSRGHQTSRRPDPRPVCGRPLPSGRRHPTSRARGRRMLPARAAKMRRAPPGPTTAPDRSPTAARRARAPCCCSR